MKPWTVHWGSGVCSNVQQMEGLSNWSIDSASYPIVLNWLDIWALTLVTSKGSHKVNVRFKRKQLESETKIVQSLFQSTQELIMWPDLLPWLRQALSTTDWVRVAMVTNAAFPAMAHSSFISQPATLIRHENEALGKRALQAGGIWKRRLSVVFSVDGK